jgi:ribosomal protein S18 acetylase RimI-like enzyme
VAELLALPGAESVAALAGGELTGYLVTMPRPESIWGPHMFVEGAGHAVADAETVRDLYAAVAADWWERGLTRHYATVPTHDPALLDGWARLGFGHQQALALRAVEPTEWPAGVREAEPGDIDGLMELAHLVSDANFASPVFNGFPRDEDDGLRDDILEMISDDGCCLLVAEVDGRIAATAEVIPVEESPMHAGVIRVDGQVLLGFAATAEWARGRGLAGELTTAAFAWAHRHGYTTLAIDWRVASLPASRLWTRQGFRPAFLRMYRAIP